jgi:hypothetical protein
VLYTYRDPPQIQALARHLLSHRSTAAVAIHHDAKSSPLEPFEEDRRLLIVPDPAVVEWGRWSQVQAIVKATRLMIAQAPEVQWIVLLTGQDWPAVPLGAVEAALGELSVDACIEAVPSTERWGWDAYQRYCYRWFSFPTWAAAAARLIGRMPRLAYLGSYGALELNMIGVASRSLRPEGLVGGIEYFALSRRAWEAVQSGYDSPRVRRRFARCLIPTEVFFATMIARAGLRIGPPVHYCRFAPGSANPEILTPAELPLARASGALFARKIAPEGLKAFAEAAEREYERPHHPGHGVAREPL